MAWVDGFLQAFSALNQGVSYTTHFAFDELPCGPTLAERVVLHFRARYGTPDEGVEHVPVLEASTNDWRDVVATACTRWFFQRLTVRCDDLDARPDASRWEDSYLLDTLIEHLAKLLHETAAAHRVATVPFSRRNAGEELWVLSSRGDAFLMDFSWSD